jgi:hypothetical protein
MSREEQLARQLCRVLNQGTQALDPVIAERLRAARERALQHQALPVTDPAILGAGGTARLGGRGDDTHPLRTLLAILALLGGVSLAYVWNGFIQSDENEEIDSALLADDLSPKALLDPGFQAWLSHYVQESAR